MKRKLDLQAFAAGEEAPAPRGPAPDGVEETASGAPETGAQQIKPEPPAAEEEAAGAQNEPPAAGEPAAEPEAAQETGALLNSVSAALDAAGLRAQADRIAAAWVAEGEALKEIYPGFDLRRAARENAEFARLLQAGVGVRRAWEAANLETILGEAMRYAARTAGKKAAQSLSAAAGRVQENSVLDRASSLSRRDVGSLTQSDILKILDEVSRGAKITF